MWLDIGHATKAFWRACSITSRFVKILGYGVDYGFCLQNGLLEKFYNCKERLSDTAARAFFFDHLGPIIPPEAFGAMLNSFFWSTTVQAHYEEMPCGSTVFSSMFAYYCWMYVEAVASGIYPLLYPLGHAFQITPAKHPNQ